MSPPRCVWRGGGCDGLVIDPPDCSYRRRQAKLQKELADAAKEPLPIEQSVPHHPLCDVITRSVTSSPALFSPKGRRHRGSVRGRREGGRRDVSQETPQQDSKVRPGWTATGFETDLKRVLHTSALPLPGEGGDVCVCARDRAT